MTQPGPAAPRPRGDIIVRIIAAVLTTMAGIPFLLLVLMVTDSRFGPASQDPHGYGLIFGTILAIPLGFVTSLLAPFIFPRPKRATAFRVGTRIFLLISVALLAMWFTGS